MVRKTLPVRKLRILAVCCICWVKTPAAARARRNRGAVEEMLEGPSGDPQIDLVGGMEQQVVAQEIEPGIDRQGRSHGDAENMQGGVGLVDQDLVDDDLEKDRGYQGNGVDKEHRQGDIDEGDLLLEDLGMNQRREKGWFSSLSL
jgi:hypothetical protein